MIRTVAVQGYRSLRDLVLPLGQLSLITGANGSGKSSVYRSLRLLADAAQNAVVAHAPQLIEVLTAASMCVRLYLVKELGETTLEGATLFNKPKWVWPAR